MSDLERLIAEAQARYEAMTPEQQRAMWQAQKTSYIRAEAGFGSDADEAEYAAALTSGDAGRIEAAKNAETARVAVADEYLRAVQANTETEGE